MLIAQLDLSGKELADAGLMHTADTGQLGLGQPSSPRSSAVRSPSATQPLPIGRAIAPPAASNAAPRLPEARAQVTDSAAATPNKTPCQRHILGPVSARACPDSLVSVASRQVADLAELKDFVEGLRAAAHQARHDGNVALAQALEITRFEVYQAYLDELTAPAARRRAED